MYDGIAIDVGGSRIRLQRGVDTETCEAIRARLAPGGRIVMRRRTCPTISTSTVDRIAARLAGDNLQVWIVDEQGIEERNAIIAGLANGN